LKASKKPWSLINDQGFFIPAPNTANKKCGDNPLISNLLWVENHTLSFYFSTDDPISAPLFSMSYRHKPKSSMDGMVFAQSYDQDT